MHHGRLELFPLNCCFLSQIAYSSNTESTGGTNDLKPKHAAETINGYFTIDQTHMEYSQG